MNRLRKKYLEVIRPELQSTLGLDNVMQVPRIVKVVLNMGIGREAVLNPHVAEKSAEQLTLISGQKSVINKARKAISSFKLRQGQPVGVSVTLRGDRMYDFIDRLINFVLPRVRDFQGVNPSSFDKQGNYSLGLPEQTLFPEVDISKVDKVRGLEVTFTIASSGQEASYLLLEKLGMPFRKKRV